MLDSTRSQDTAAHLPLVRRPDIPALDIVIPCYNEQEVIPALLDRLTKLGDELVAKGHLSKRPRLILVDDGSSDETWNLMKNADGVLGVRLSRNHGHQAALVAGLKHSTAEVVISMDADLQDDPSVIGEMIDAYMNGAEVVYGVRALRERDTPFKRGTAQTYYKVLSALGVDIIPDHADFRLMSRKAINLLWEFPERNLFLRALVRKIGLRSATVHYNRMERVGGTSKYDLAKMVGFALEGVTSFSIRPLRLIAWVGFVIAGIAILASIYAFVGWLFGAVVPGWTSIVLPIYILGGAHLLALGIVGEYVGKIYLEVKNRPRFIVEDLSDPADSNL
jgi:polyisoprenyl-phosphate glycosyltransferase